MLTLKAPVTLPGYPAGDDGRRVHHRIDVMGLDDPGERREVQHVPLKGHVVRGTKLLLQVVIPRLEVHEDETLTAFGGELPERGSDKPAARNQSRHARQSSTDGAGLGEDTLSVYAVESRAVVP